LALRTVILRLVAVWVVQEQAREMDLHDILVGLLRHSSPKFKRHLEYILQQLGVWGAVFAAAIG
jgi:hypothetical protein